MYKPNQNNKRTQFSRIKKVVHTDTIPRCPVWRDSRSSDGHALQCVNMHATDGASALRVSPSLSSPEIERLPLERYRFSKRRIIENTSPAVN